MNIFDRLSVSYPNDRMTWEEVIELAKGAFIAKPAPNPSPTIYGTQAEAVLNQRPKMFAPENRMSIPL